MRSNFAAFKVSPEPAGYFVAPRGATAPKYLGMQHSSPIGAVGVASGMVTLRFQPMATQLGKQLSPASLFSREALERVADPDAESSHPASTPELRDFMAHYTEVARMGHLLLGAPAFAKLAKLAPGGQARSTKLASAQVTLTTTACGIRPSETGGCTPGVGDGATRSASGRSRTLATVVCPLSNRACKGLQII